MPSEETIARTTRAMLLVVAVLMALGLVMLGSASRVAGALLYKNPDHFIERQIAWGLLALLAGVVVSRLDYHLFKRYAWWLLAIMLVSLVLVFVPGIGVRRGGSYRWINLAGMRFQPSELAKLVIVISLAAFYAIRPRWIPSFWKGIALPASWVVVTAVLLLKEPDFGTAALILGVGVAVIFASGTHVWSLAFLSVCGAGLFGVAILHSPHRLGRVIAFLYPDRFPDLYYQLGQSKDAFALGGLFGLGLGNSIQKHYYLPEAHTDFIFAIIGEELGLPATIAVIVLFAVFCVCALRISARAPDRFGRLLGYGLALMIVVQAVFNIAVATGCMPTTGITLPFISYGGSSLLFSMIMVGILVNIARHADPAYRDRHTRVIGRHAMEVGDL